MPVRNVIHVTDRSQDICLEVVASLVYGFSPMGGSLTYINAERWPSNQPGVCFRFRFSNIAQGENNYAGFEYSPAAMAAGGRGQAPEAKAVVSNLCF